MARILRFLPLLLLVVSWTTAAEAIEVVEVWDGRNRANVNLPQWSHTGDRSKVTGCWECAKVATGLRAKDNASDSRENGTLAEDPTNVVQFVRKVTTEHFTRDPLTTDGQKPLAKTDSVLKLMPDKKMLAKNLIPNRKVPMSLATRNPSKDTRMPLPKIRVFKDKAVLPPTEVQQTNGPSRQHKAFFVNYPSSQRVYQGKDSRRMASNTAKKQKQKQKQKLGKRKPDSDIYFIRLPPTPYSYVPGLGFVSQPAKFSTSLLASPQRRRKPQSPMIKLPLEFVSNGKPTSVYRWSPSTSTGTRRRPPQQHQKQQQQKQQQQKQQQQQQHNRRPPTMKDSTVIKLDRGPYVFDGRPVNVYIMKKEPRPVAPNLV